ncbi:MAG: hypothetical protein KGN02_05365 [bacterium]|nr:hypothetical protein [bacterium]
MKRTLILSCALLAIGAAATVAHAAPAAKDPCASKPSKWARAQCESFTHSAPGDEYFGRMKLSYLGINNTFHDESIRAGAYTTDSGIISKVGFADEALNAWSQRFPGDPQLARSYFLAIQMYKKIYTQTAQQKAWSYMNLLVKRFPTTYFGKLEKADLARGFTEHWFALPQLCPTPLPTGVMPETTPAATATPEPKAGEPKVDIITPPCVQPSLPPSPSPSPGASSHP